MYTHCTSWRQSFCSGQRQCSCSPHWLSDFSSTFCSGKRNKTNLEHLLFGKWTKLQLDSWVCLQKSKCRDTHQGSTRAGYRRPYCPGWWWCPGSDRIGTKTKKSIQCQFSCFSTADRRRCIFLRLKRFKMTHVVNKPQTEGGGDPLPGVDPTVDPHGLLARPVVQRQLRGRYRSRV